MKHLWLYFNLSDLRVEREQLRDEGKDLSGLAPEFDRLEAAAAPADPEWQRQAQYLSDRTQQLPQVQGYAFAEPSDLAGIRRARPQAEREFGLRLSDAELLDRIYGAWLGRCAGCLLGKPVEGQMSAAMWGYLKEAGLYPLRDYFRSDAAPEHMSRHGFSLRVDGCIDKVDCMVEDDDTNYTAVGMLVMKNRGRDFAPEHVAECWMQELPLLHTCTAERVAYRNFALQIAPPASALWRNPYREWIGAQIRADFFGYVAPGDPERAAEYAWRDACISHVKNGIYGEMWVAAMLAAAPALDEPEAVLRAGLAEIPARSRLAAAVNEVISWKRAGIDYVEAIARIHQRWDERNSHHWCHTVSNAEIVTLALLWGERNFEQTICRAVEACFDTDCNGATAGSVLGMMLGAEALPKKWTAPLRDRLRTGLAGYHDVKISDLARETFELARRFAVP